MADDWQVGDLALCVKVGLWVFVRSGEPSYGDTVKGGGVYTVAAIATQDGETILWFDEHGCGPEDCYRSDRFRKITPPPADEFDREVIELLRREPVPSMKDRIV